LQNFNIECKKCNNYGHKIKECRLPMQSLKIGKPDKQNKKTWKRKSEVPNKKDDETIAPEIDELNNRRLVGKTSNKEYNNQIYAYKVDQTQDMKTPKEKYDNSKIDNVIQEAYPLPNKWKLIEEYSQDKDKEASSAHNSDVDDESPTIEQQEELSDYYLRIFSNLF
jgi:plasmid replication initiation protein